MDGFYSGDKEQSIKHEWILTGLSSVFGHQVGGLAVIFEVLCNSADADVEEKSEAAGLLAQITSPWLEPPQPTSDGQNAWPTLHLTPYISSFIAALTGKNLNFGALPFHQIPTLSTRVALDLTLNRRKS
jgi:hypothetical protein